MSNNLDVIEKHHVFNDSEEKYSCKIRRSEHNYRQVYEYDKKMKREIANSNERRRMQSINTGFETLKELLPMSADEEKLSKASILQLTAKYIQNLLSRLSTLEKEIASFKKLSTSNKEKFSQNKSPSSLSQEHNRKRRLNSCTTVPVTLDVSSRTDMIDISGSIRSFSVPGSEECLLTCDNAEKTPGSLEHLVAAIEQVEGEKFYVGSTLIEKQPKIILTTGLKQEKFAMSESENQLSNLLNFNHSAENNAVMKPTISPYTEKIILAVSQHPHMFDRDLSAHIFDTSNPSVPIAFQLIATDTAERLNTIPSPTFRQ